MEGYIDVVRTDKYSDSLVDVIHEVIAECQSVRDGLQKIDDLIARSRLSGAELQRLAEDRGHPSVGPFLTDLSLCKAYDEYRTNATWADQYRYDTILVHDILTHHSSLSQAFESLRDLPIPNHRDIRTILNIAQLNELKGNTKLVSLDADGTIYSDGENLEKDSPIVSLMIALMRKNVHVAIVTAASYPNETIRFETRIQGLLEAFKEAGLSREMLNQFHLIGGECNYFLRVNDEFHLEEIPHEKEPWKTETMLSWAEADIQAMLDDAFAATKAFCEEKQVSNFYGFKQKERAIGMYPKCEEGCRRVELFEELAIHLQDCIRSRHTRIPFCAFNGGPKSGVWLDVGNKGYGLEILHELIGINASESVHLGDQFTRTGNDFATREKSPTIWVASPKETQYYLEQLLAASS